VGLERGPLSLVSTTEELLGRNSSDSGLESRDYGPSDPSDQTTLSILKSWHQFRRQAAVAQSVQLARRLNYSYMLYV
jgi:hypothetical protein